MMQYQPQEPQHFYDSEYGYTVNIDDSPSQNLSQSTYQPAPSTYRPTRARSRSINRSYSPNINRAATVPGHMHRTPTPGIPPRVSRSRSRSIPEQNSDSGFGSEPDRINISVGPATYSEFDYGGEGVMPHRDHQDSKLHKTRSRSANHYNADPKQIPLVFQYLVLALLLIWCFSVTEAQSSSQQDADLGIPLSDLFRLVYWVVRFSVGFVAKVLLMLGLPDTIVWAVMGSPPMILLGYFVLAVL